MTPPEPPPDNQGQQRPATRTFQVYCSCSDGSSPVAVSPFLWTVFDAPLRRRGDDLPRPDFEIDGGG